MVWPVNALHHQMNVLRLLAKKALYLYVMVHFLSELEVIYNTYLIAYDRELLIFLFKIQSRESIMYRRQSTLK